MLSSLSTTHGRTSRPAPTTTATATTIESSRLVVRVQCDANVLAPLREVPDLVDPTKIVEAVRKKKTSLEDDGVEDSSKDITIYCSKDHNGAGHVQRSGGALAATHGQSVVLAQLEAQFRGEAADEGDQAGSGAVSRGHCEDPFRRCKCILALCDWLTRRPCQQHACRHRPRREIGGERDSSIFSKVGLLAGWTSDDF
ncbi:hypothetical protein PC123_g1950 [Phytophthora cactorum]|nr:hypothetical protein PC123_g1950 [Phytophthora cactorum]